MQRSAVVIGGGIVGLATARCLAVRHADLRVVVVEKEAQLASHQTGRNSGVIHSGIYYKPGSVKALTCTQGRALLLEMCRERGIRHEMCGKVIVATNEGELPQLDKLLERAAANGVRARRITREELREREPAAAGIAALLVEDAGIVDYAGVCAALAEEIHACGGEIALNTRVSKVERIAGASASSPLRARVAFDGRAEAVEADLVVNCAGVFSDRVARAAGAEPQAQIVPFRGEYYRLRHGAPELCRHLIYPVPNPEFPFLGVHLTRMIGGGVECGPNAVLALGREAYSWREFSMRDVMEIAAFPGVWKLAAKHWRDGLGEVRRSLHRNSFVRALQVLVPQIRAEHLEPAPAGIRAQAMDRSGGLLDDFCVQTEPPMVHVLNAPSPAATASLAIGLRIVAQAEGVGVLPAVLPA